MNWLNIRVLSGVAVLSCLFSTSIIIDPKLIRCPYFNLFLNLLHLLAYYVDNLLSLPFLPAGLVDRLTRSRPHPRHEYLPTRQVLAH